MKGKMLIVLSLLMLLILGACSIADNNKSVDVSNTEQTSDLPKPGDEDFIGPVRDEDIERFQDK